MLKDGGVALNKEKVTEDFTVTSDHLLREKYLLIQKGKKNYYLVKAM
jgi:tyrosyl-tRNA synthetase